MSLSTTNWTRRLGDLGAGWSNRAIWLLVPVVAIFAVVFVFPVFSFLTRSVTVPDWGLQNFEVLFQRSAYLRVIWNTIYVSATVAVLCLLLGYPLAYNIVHSRPSVRRWLIFIVLIPFWTSLLVRTFAWMVILQREGILNSSLIALGIVDEPLSLIYNRAGVLIGMVQVLLPFVVFPLLSVMQRIDLTYSAAASTLGAPPVTNFLRIYLPLSLPGILSGGMLVFVLSLGYFITPALLGGRKDTMIAQLIQQQVSEFGNWGFASAISVVLLASVVLISVTIRSALNWSKK
jgi:putative spermidine/putrescine transport system permease protein